MGNCKDCTFWGSSNVGGKECRRVEWLDNFETVPEDRCAVYAEAHDDSGLTAFLATGPMFGCVNFKKKKVKKADNRAHISSRLAKTGA